MLTNYYPMTNSGSYNGNGRFILSYNVGPNDNETHSRSKVLSSYTLRTPAMNASAGHGKKNDSSRVLKSSVHSQ